MSLPRELGESRGALVTDRLPTGSPHPAGLCWTAVSLPSPAWRCPSEAVTCMPTSPQVLLDWINDVLVEERIIVKQLEEDLYDGQVLQKLLGEWPGPTGPCLLACRGCTVTHPLIQYPLGGPGTRTV